MKKLISIIVTGVMILSIVGCGATLTSPEDTVKNYFEAAKNLDIKAMAATINPSNIEDIEETESLLDETDDYTKYFMDYFKDNAKKITYEITGSEMDGSSAVVTVDCKYVDSSPILMATIGEAFSQIMSVALSGVEMTEKETEEIFMDIMKQQSEILDETFTEATIEIECEEIDGKWYISETSNDLVDVVMSGFISAGEELSNSF